MKTIFTAKEIEEKTRKLSNEIFAFYADKPEPLVLSVLTGGMFFAVDMIRYLQDIDDQKNWECGVISASHYPRNATPNEDIKIDFLSNNVSGRDILLVDEICYTGKTLHKLEEMLLTKGAKSVKSVVLIYQQKEDSVYTPDFWVLFYQGELWLYGQGMDSNGSGRGLRDIVA